jgi:catechol 2,3-dioxygenase-like lactoylglutathione lyase family enzyme
MTSVKSIIAVAPIVADPDESAALYGDVLGLDFYRLETGYLGTEKLNGITHFGLWPLQEAARTCFGADTWPSDVRIPQACIEFDVDDFKAAVAELEAAGHRLLQAAGNERVARFLTSEGLVVVVSEGELAE